MFTSRRFTPAPTQDYSFVTIQNPACRPAKVCHSEIGGGTVYINAVPINGRDGKPNTKELISFRAANKQALKEAIEKDYQASFSSTGEADVTEAAKASLAQLRQQAQSERPVMEQEKQQAYSRLARAYGQGTEVTLDKALAQGISERVFLSLYHQEAQNFAATVTQEHRVLAAELSSDEQAELTRANVQMFSQQQPWKDWLKQFDGNFWSYPNLTNKNYFTLVNYCSARGWTCPLMGEIEEAVRTLLEGGFFHMRATYYRTNRDEMRRVKEFTGLDCIPAKPAPVDDRKQAIENTKGLNATQLKAQLGSERNSRKLAEWELRDRARRTY